MNIYPLKPSERLTHKEIEQITGKSVTNSEEDAPLDLIQSKGKENNYPVEALGKILQPAVDITFSKAVKAPLSICAQSFLAAACFAVQDIGDVRLDGRIYPVSNFFLTVGESGSRKSTVDSIALRKHYALMFELCEQSERWQRRYKFELEKYTREIENLKKSEADIEEMMSLNRPEPPPDPVGFIVQEPTFEGLQKCFILGSPSVGFFSDEGAQFFGGYSMGKDHSIKTAAGLSKFWDGKSQVRTRATAGESNIIKRPRLTTHLMVQGKVASQFLNDEMINNQGLLGRFLCVDPGTDLFGTRAYESYDIESSPEINSYLSQVSQVLRQFNPYREDRPEKRRILDLTPSAKAYFISFFDHVEQQVGKNGQFEFIAPFAQKAGEHVLRLAGALVLFADPEAALIGLEAITSACTLGWFYLEEFNRILGHSNVTREVEVAQLILDMAERLQMDKISMNSIYRKITPARLRNQKDILKKAVEVLIEHGSIRKSGRCWQVVAARSVAD